MQNSALLNGIRAEIPSGQESAAVRVIIDGAEELAREGERLIDLLNRNAIILAQVCYHPQLGPIQTCDACMVEIGGKLVRACATIVADGMQVSTISSQAQFARKEAFDRILSNHMLYCILSSWLTNIRSSRRTGLRSNPAAVPSARSSAASRMEVFPALFVPTKRLTRVRGSTPISLKVRKREICSFLSKG